MNPWKCERWKKYYSGKERHKGLSVHYSHETDPMLKTFLSDFARWLRENYHFPVSVDVYVMSDAQICAMDGDMVSATFFGPYDREDQPYIRIAAGDFYGLSAAYGRFSALCSTAASLAHELTHYYQWLNDLKLSVRTEEKQAEKYSEKIVYEYLYDRGYDLAEELEKQDI